LQRRLSGERVGFGFLLNEVRRELAERYLAASHRIAAVASLTGYDRASSFTRWFGAEFGVSPARWRQTYSASWKG
jgi:AraC-like DNA-binding protein